MEGELMKLTIDATTGKETYEPLTQAEMDDKNNLEAEFIQIAEQDELHSSNEQQMSDSIRSRYDQMLSLADKLNNNTATPAEQRQALELCLRGLVRLSKLFMRELNNPT